MVHSKQPCLGDARTDLKRCTTALGTSRYATPVTALVQPELKVLRNKMHRHAACGQEKVQWCFSPASRSCAVGARGPANRTQPPDKGLVISPSGACTGSKNKIKRCKASMHGAGTYMVRIPCMLLSCRNLLLINSAIWDPVRTQAGLLGLVGKYIGWFWLGAAQCTQSGIRAPCCTNAALFVCTAAAELPPAMSDVDVATVTQQLLVGCVPGGACLSQIQPPGTMLSTDTGILLCKIRARDLTSKCWGRLQSSLVLKST